jgi:energy-converting hydrogenase Eha subunit G
MHNLQVIRNVAADALDDEGTGGLDAFHAVVDPGSVLEMAAIIAIVEIFISALRL